MKVLINLLLLQKNCEETTHFALNSIFNNKLWIIYFFLFAFLVGNAGKKMCPVCGDLVSGIHYGVHTCESCKSFFKRAISFDKSLTFDCEKMTGGCNLTPYKRSCKYCRYHKCIEAGMLPTLIRLKKERGGRSSIYLKNNVWMKFVLSSRWHGRINIPPYS